MIRFCWLVDTSAIFWRFCLMIFFCIFFISSLSAIFIMTSHLLQSDDDSFLKCCFLIDNSSFITFAHNMIFDEKRVFLCICNCLLNSWMNIFNFCTFCVMNASWLLIFLSEMFWKHWISFKITSFRKWSLLFSFFNIDVCVNRLMMLITFILLLHECLNLASLSLYNESTLLAIIIESALLLLMQFIIIYSFTQSFLFCL